jgi:hypothetical protein
VSGYRLGAHLGQLELDGLVAGDGLAEGLALPPAGPPGTAREENLNFEAFRSTVAKADEPPNDDGRLSSWPRLHGHAGRRVA